MTADPLDIPAASDLRRATVRLARRLRAERAPDGLSPNKLGVLARLHRDGPATPGDIAAAEFQQPQTLTRVFAELERDGLVLRQRDERDRRQSMLAITGVGRAALERDAARRDAWLAAALSGLTLAERQLLAIAAGLMERLADSQDQPEGAE